MKERTGAGAVLWLIAGLLSGLAVIGPSHPPTVSGQSRRPAVATIGRLAPMIDTVTMQGQTFRLTSVHEPVVLNFWASWCEFCRVEAPDVVRLAANAHGRYQVLTVNVTAIDTLQNARQFARTAHLPSPILLDPTGQIQRAYEVEVLPTTFYLNARGIVVSEVQGAESYQTMRQHIQEAEQS